MSGNFFKKWWKGLIYEPSDPRHLAGGKIKIAVIGGGTGLSVLLRGLKSYSNDISAIVAVTDDGASSGALRKEFDILPPGDIRKCISALTYDEELVSNLMEYRFKKRGSTLDGHTLGNIWITALTKYFGSFEKAVEATTAIFETAGQVLPATLGNAKLCAEYEDGAVAVGESKVPKAGKRIIKISLDKRVAAYKRAVSAISVADLIIIGPGSLYTSIIPNFLIGGIRRTVKQSKAVKIFVCNCSTERGETEGYVVDDHIRAIYKHSGRDAFNYCLVNKKVVVADQESSALGKINNITTSKKTILGCQIATYDVVSSLNPLYHDSQKLAKAVIEMYNSIKHN